MRRRVALQGTCGAKTAARVGPVRDSFGVRARPRVAFPKNTAPCSRFSVVRTVGITLGKNLLKLDTSAGKTRYNGSRRVRSGKGPIMMNDYILHDKNLDGIDRRGFLKCMAWAGTGVLWTVSGGMLTSKILGATADISGADFTFAQISDSHIGFNGTAGLVAEGSGAARFEHARGGFRAYPTLGSLPAMGLGNR